jgi:glycosyltransferase involved in cell wall biosynthesis
MRAHARARAAGLEADLVFAGRGRLASRLRSPGVHLLGRVTDADLDALYAGALALVFPSWLEGFGLPPLEAAARGTASIVSDLAVYAETLGDAALRFPAGDEEALARALLTAADDPSLRHAVAERARARVATMTWERAALRTRAILAEAALAG